MRTCPPIIAFLSFLVPLRESETKLAVILPFSPAGIPGSDDFDWKAVNYAPIALAILFVFVAVMWFTNGKKHFTGMRRTVDESADK